MTYYTDFATIPRRYTVIYADPPWAYRDKCHAGQRGAEYKYPTMTGDELHQLPVPDIAGPDAVCFMWATFPQLPNALDLMRAWGFAYKTVAFTWVKRTTRNARLHWGMGNWTRANAEICLLGTRGRPIRASAGVHSIIEAPIGAHSRKPSEVRNLIVTLLGDVPRIELFARGDTPGWDQWGDTPTYQD